MRLRKALARVASIGIYVTLCSFIPDVVSANSDSAGADLHHESFLGDIEMCKTCHRQGNNGIADGGNGEAEKALCLSCHGHNATGAATDVEWGVIRGSDVGLRSGGFVRGLMDTSLSGTPEVADVTSNHTVGIEPGMVWGYGEADPNPDYGITVTLRCTSCHNPHGNGNYRALRTEPMGLSVDSKAANLADETDRDYAMKYDVDFRRDTSYVPTGVSEWCSQCHTRYMAGPEAGHTDSGDAVFKYGHSSLLPGGCLSCHLAHGTTATMGPWSGAVTRPDGSGGGGVHDSRLLALDNRGTCVSCHADISAD